MGGAHWAHVLTDGRYAHHLSANRMRSQTYWCQKQPFQMKEGLHGFLCLGVQSDLWSRAMMAEKDSFLQRNLTLTRILVHALDIQTTARFLSAMALVRRPLECLVQIFQSLSHELASSWDNCMCWSSRCNFFHKFKHLEVHLKTRLKQNICCKYSVFAIYKDERSNKLGLCLWWILWPLLLWQACGQCGKMIFK